MSGALTDAQILTIWERGLALGATERALLLLSVADTECAADEPRSWPLGKRDAKLLEALFTADADQLVTTGEWRQGRDNVVRGGLASSQANPGSRQITIEAVRFVAPGVAIADGRYEITDAQATAPRRMRTTFVVVRSAAASAAGTDAWRIAAIRNMAPTDPAR